MSIYTNNLKAMEVLLEPNLWKFVEIEQVSPTKAAVICKTSAAAGNHFVRSTVSFRPTEENKMVVALTCNFLNAKYKATCDDCESIAVITDTLRSLLAEQEAAYYSDSIPEHFKEMMSPRDFYISMNLNPDWPEVHQL